jgi:hypothetical protein
VPASAIRDTCGSLFRIEAILLGAAAVTARIATTGWPQRRDRDDLAGQAGEKGCWVKRLKILTSSRPDGGNISVASLHAARDSSGAARVHSNYRMNGATTVNTRVYEGIPNGNDVHLCGSCRYQFRNRDVNDRRTELCLARPTTRGAGTPVPARVVDCNFYINRMLPDMETKEKSAWILGTITKGKPIGFMSPAEYRKRRNLGDDEPKND